jgi:hypothetical protein
MISRKTASRPSPALIVAVVALVAALAGTAVAADPSASTSALSKKKVKKIANKAAAKAVDAQFPIQEAQLGDGAVTSPKILDGDVGSEDLGSNSVNAAKIIPNAVGTSELGTITPRSESYTVEDDATPHEREEVDCNAGEQAIAGDVSSSILTDQPETNITESNYDPAGATGVANDTGWIFAIGNMDDVAGVGDGDSASLSGTLTVLCLAR